MDVGFKEALIFVFEECLKNPGYNLALNGDLGAGKTYFISHLIKKIDPVLSKEVSSPSFSFCNSYITESVQIDHFDLYRLEEEEQLDEIGLFESLDNPKILTLVEWAGMFRGLNRFFNGHLTLSESGTIRNYHIENMNHGR